MAWHVGNLACDIPQCDVDARYGCTASNTATVPKVLTKHTLPQMLNPARVFAYQQRSDVFNSAYDAAGMPLERRFAPANETRLVSRHLNENPISHAGVTDDCFDGCYFHVGSGL
jgi:hypothetical protein